MFENVKVGFIPDGKLVELLELALSADNVVNMVRCIRDLVDSGIEPMALLSQLANLITDLLAGNCNHGFLGSPPGNTCKIISLCVYVCILTRLQALHRSLILLFIYFCVCYS